VIMSTKFAPFPESYSDSIRRLNAFHEKALASFLKPVDAMRIATISDIVVLISRFGRLGRLR
jgi:hypothetical protein